MKKFLAVTIGILAAAYYMYNFLNIKPPLPPIHDTIWKDEDGTIDNEIYPFSINVTKKNLEYLKRRLRDSVYAPPLKGVNFTYGFNTDHLQKIVNYWLNDYNWNEREKLLNAVPQFRTRISGLNIHFIHLKPHANVLKQKRVLPLLLLHGWPGSVKEFYKVLPLLVSPQSEYDFVFEVVVPSLPGYGFSEAATKPGLDTAHIALIMKKLMNRIGFTKFYVQGGDWGSIIGTDMITFYPESVNGFHSNLCIPPISSLSMIKMVIGSFFPEFMTSSSFKYRLYPFREIFAFLAEETGYLHVQATKPDTIGVALLDSPVGLAAYILEKFSTWENYNRRDSPDGGLSLEKLNEKNYCIDDLLDNVMIYWLTGSITSSMRLYKESVMSTMLRGSPMPTLVPTACAQYPFEIMHHLESIIREKFRNLVYLSHMPQGGHFPAFEEPKLFVSDVRKAICTILNFVENAKQIC